MLETGLRVVTVLEALAPEAVDLNTVCLLDYHVVHTADVGGPKSLHPDITVRAGEYLVRRRLVEDGIRLMHRIQLIVIVHDASGVRFRSSDGAAMVVDLMRTSYNLELKRRAGWLAAMLIHRGDGFADDLRARLDELVLADGGLGPMPEIRA